MEVIAYLFGVIALAVEQVDQILTEIQSRKRLEGVFHISSKVYDGVEGNGVVIGVKRAGRIQASVDITALYPFS